MSAYVETVRARVDLVEVIGRSVILRKSGAGYEGLCPHRETRPSLCVFPSSRVWRCFGCGRIGSCFDRLMLRDELTFREAVAALGAQVGSACT